MRKPLSGTGYGRESSVSEYLSLLLAVFKTLDHVFWSAKASLLFLFLSWPKEGKEAEGSFGNKAPLKVKPAL